MKVKLIKPYGFCMGVINAIDIAKETKAKNPTKNVTILGMLVHNQDVINELDSYGIKTISDETKPLNELLSQIKDGIVIFTAHGHNKELEKQAIEQGLIFIDATCKYVTYNQKNILKALEEGYEVIYIGKDGHLETISTLSLNNNICFYDIKKGLQKAPKSSKIKVFNQTTLSLLDIKNIYDNLSRSYNIEIGDEICNATRVRQELLLKEPYNYDLVIIIGDSKSNNTLSLDNIAKHKYPNSFVMRVSNLLELKEYDLNNVSSALIITGTSTPLSSADEIIEYLKNK